MSDSESVKAVIDFAKMTTNEFSASLGWKRAMNLYNILNGKSNISVKVCNIICNKYPEINYNWLLYGTGDMLNNKNKPEHPPPEHENSLLTYDSHKERDLHRLEAIVEEMKRINTELIEKSLMDTQINMFHSEALANLTKESLLKTEILKRLSEGNELGKALQSTGTHD